MPFANPNLDSLLALSGEYQFRAVDLPSAGKVGGRRRVMP